MEQYTDFVPLSSVGHLCPCTRSCFSHMQANASDRGCLHPCSFFVVVIHDLMGFLSSFPYGHIGRALTYIKVILTCNLHAKQPPPLAWNATHYPCTLLTWISVCMNIVNTYFLLFQVGVFCNKCVRKTDLYTYVCM